MEEIDVWRTAHQMIELHGAVAEPAAAAPAQTMRNQSSEDGFHFCLRSFVAIALSHRSGPYHPLWLTAENLQESGKLQPPFSLGWRASFSVGMAPSGNSDQFRTEFGLKTGVFPEALCCSDQS